MKNYIFFFLSFIFFSISYANEIKITKLEIKNLPDGYYEVFKDFFKENLYTKNNLVETEIKINWITYSYNICIYISKENILVEVLCTTSNTAEKIYDNLKNLLSDSEYISLKEIKRKNINLSIIGNSGEITERKAKIISEKGDFLTDYKVVYAKKEKPFIYIGGANFSVDLIILNEYSASFLLKKMLNNYKIDKIFISK